MNVDRQLTSHFKLLELVVTDHKEFQAKNQDITQAQLEKLTHVAELEELVRTELGCGLYNHSAYRCPELNKAVGSSDRSQHLLCEAVDFSRFGHEYTEETLEKDFRTLIAAAKAGRIHFGQLIKESVKRYIEGKVHVAMWLHISLGAPWRPAERCGQCLVMKDGVYTSVGTV